MEPANQTQHWPAISRRWNFLGSPLRPCAEDVSNYRTLLDAPAGAAPRFLVLGVTPELHDLGKSIGGTVQAVDRSGEMIGAIWPGEAGTATQADWLDPGGISGSFDAIFCDGGLHLLAYPSGQRALSARLAMLLRPGGQFLIRLFAWPGQPEKADDVLADLHAKRIPGMHHFKLRLAMALQARAESGVVLQDVYDRVIAAFGSLERLQAASGWPPDEVATLSSYQHSRDCYHFVTLPQAIEAIISSGQLEFLSERVGKYPLGERCPVLMFRKTAT